MPLDGTAKLSGNQRQSHDVFLTGLDDVTDQEKGFELGAEDYITKPDSPNIVQSRVDRISREPFARERKNYRELPRGGNKANKSDFPNNGEAM